MTTTRLPAASRSFSRAGILSFLSLPLALLQSGCGTLGYLYQAGMGQLAIQNRARPIRDVIHDPRTPSELKALLARVPDIKAFGEERGLKATSNYEEYVQLDRPAANWVVSASRSLRFESRTWSFPIVGSFTYLGWFDLEAAEEYAGELKAEGWDVDLRGAAAYSTLGWFRDPIFSTMIPKGPRALGDLVNIVLHESVHATVYVNGQSVFNESVASFAADRMTYEYLREKHGDQSEVYQSYLKKEERGAATLKRLSMAYEELSKLYASPKSDEEKRRKKGEILARVTRETQFKREINNATLIQFKTYGTGLASFERLYSACGRNWKFFLAVVGGLKGEDFGAAQRGDFSPVIDGLAKSEACRTIGLNLDIPLETVGRVDG